MKTLLKLVMLVILAGMIWGCSSDSQQTQPSDTANTTSTNITPDWSVNSLEDAPVGCPEACTLRHALALAQVDDIIGFADGLSGTIVLRAPLVIDKSIEIIGSANQTIVLDGGGTMRVFEIRIEDSTSRTVRLANFTIQNGFASKEGYTENGGGLAILENGIQSITLDNMIFANNQSAGDGGAIALSSESATIQNSTFINNKAIGCSACGAYVRGNGGAIYNISQPDMTSNYSFTIANSTFIGNTANENGGALYLSQALNAYGDTQANITNSTFTQNSAQGLGGAIRIDGVQGAMNINYSTIVDNTAGQGGGLGIIGTMSLNDSIIAFNRRLLGGENEDILLESTITSSGTNIIGKFILGNNVENPFVFDKIGIDPMLLELGNYGGKTQTFALQANSPAINTGGSSPCPTTDQRGETRTAPCDVGAVEFTNQIDGNPFVVTEAEVRELTCADTVDGLEESLGLEVGLFLQVVCPTDCASNNTPVYGTDIYDGSSSICRASLHIGITSGQPFRLTIVGGAYEYTGSRRNDITSRNSGDMMSVYDLSFSIVP